MENQGECETNESLFAWFNNKKLKEFEEKMDTNTLKSLIHGMKVKCMINEHSFKEHISLVEDVILIKTVIGGEETGVVWYSNIYRHDDNTKRFIQHYTKVKEEYQKNKEHIKEKI
tara:strand:+ start:43490 stop:43834 length:345 start_codon:yes stop_codon:yes gene_type:complete